MTDETAHPDSQLSRPLGEDSTGFDPTTNTFHSRFDTDSDPLVVSIVEAVAAVTNRDPTAMAPLYDTVDPEALADLVTSARERPVDVAFDYEGCEVTVSSDGRIVVELPPN